MSKTMSRQCSSETQTAFIGNPAVDLVGLAKPTSTDAEVLIRPEAGIKCQ
jgi:hypothetical protein